MSTFTQNYNLKKPAATDNINIEDINQNMDSIDTALNEKSEKTHGHNLTEASITGALPVTKGGTGAIEGTMACSNIGAAQVGHKHNTEDIYSLNNMLASKSDTGHTHTLSSTSITGTLPISKGGTGATSASTARTNIGAASTSHTHALTSTSITGVLPMSKGGTGSSDLSEVLQNLGFRAGTVVISIADGQNSGSAAITFDTPYSTSSYAVAACVNSSVVAGETMRNVTVGSISANGFTIYLGRGTATNGAYSAAVYWMTIPYVNQ